MAQGGLFGAVRATDPVTSHQAAQAQRGGLSALILEAFQTLGPMSDDALAACLSTFHAPSIKTARSRLSKADLLVDTGETCLSARGCAMVVWRLAP